MINPGPLALQAEYITPYPLLLLILKVRIASDNETMQYCIVLEPLLSQSLVCLHSEVEEPNDVISAVDEQAAPIVMQC